MSNPSTTPLATFLQLKYKFDSYAKLINNFTTREGKDFDPTMPSAWVVWKEKMAAAGALKKLGKKTSSTIDFQAKFY